MVPRLYKKGELGAMLISFHSTMEFTTTTKGGFGIKGQGQAITWKAGNIRQRN